MTDKLKEQLDIVEEYLANLNNYKTNEPDGFWAGLKATKLKNKDEKYIDEINDLIEERINIGIVAYKKKYNLS